MKTHAAFAMAAALVLTAANPGRAQVRMAPTPGYAAPPVVLPTPLPAPLPQPQLTAPALTPSLPPLAVQVVPPPPPNEKAEQADGGDCTCPDGQKPDPEGWCWQETDAARGERQRTQMCE